MADAMMGATKVGVLTERGARARNARDHALFCPAA
jgi:hypothetical protein